MKRPPFLTRRQWWRIRLAGLRLAIVCRGDPAEMVERAAAWARRHPLIKETGKEDHA